MKYKHIVFFLFIYFVFLFPAMAMTPNVEYISNVYSNRRHNNYTHYGQLGYITYNGRFLFCLEPYEIVGTDYEVNNTYFNNYDPNALNYIKMVANYVNHNLEVKGSHYYMAAQELIWERITGYDMVYWTTKAKTEGDRINIDSFKNEIDSYVNNFLTKPSFDNMTVSDKFFSTVILEDTNNVLMNYQVINNSKNNVWISGNKLYINILSSDFAEIKLVRKYGSGDAIFYHTNSGQDLAALASYVENVSNIYVYASNLYNEDINVEFVDRETNSLVGNIDFNINDNSFNTFDGRYMSNLESGGYDIKVDNVPYGYLLPDNYHFEVSENDIHQSRTFKIYLDKPISILRVKSDGLYQLYKKGIPDTLISTSTNSSEFKLDFTDYYVIDLINNKKCDIEVKYKDQYTKVIYHDLNLSENNDVSNKRKKEESLEKNKEELVKQKVENNEGVKDNVIEEKSVNEDIKTTPIIEENVGIADNNHILPNTFNYIKIIKTILIIICIILIIKHAKEIFKD